jgi:hypothetical protein
MSMHRLVGSPAIASRRLHTPFSEIAGRLRFSYQVILQFHTQSRKDIGVV